MKRSASIFWLLAGLCLYGCSTPSPQSLADNDPFEKTNRDIFDFDVRVDHVVARPIAKGYRTVVPEPVRDGIHNALTNLNSPSSWPMTCCRATATRPSTPRGAS